MEHFILEHGGALVSGVIAIMTVVIMYLVIRVMVNIDLGSLGMLLG